MAKVETDETKIAVLVEKVGTMNTTLVKLDGKFDTLSDKFATKEQVTTIEVKVSDLEDWKNRMLGALVMIQFVWAAILYYFTGHR